MKYGICIGIVLFYGLQTTAAIVTIRNETGPSNPWKIECKTSTIFGIVKHQNTIAADNRDGVQINVPIGDLLICRPCSASGSCRYMLNMSPSGDTTVSWNGNEWT